MKFSFVLLFSATIPTALVSFISCLAAEFKKSKKNDLRLDGNKLCYLPGSAAFELGIAALICLFISQIIGNLFIFRKLSCIEHGGRCKVRNPTISCSLLVFSWVSFGIAVILISGATSMSQNQAWGEGWLDGECYLVKDGVYVGSAILILVAMGSMLSSGAMTIRRRQVEEEIKVHAQVGNNT